MSARCTGAPTAKRSRRRSRTAGASRASTRRRERRRRVRTLVLAREAGRCRIETRRRRRPARCRRSSTSCPRPAGTSARRTTSTACASTATSRCGRSSTTTSTSPAGRCPCTGRDAYQVAVGPIHAGVIESGHFRFHVVGELILHVDARLFYKHRGLERAAEGSTPRRTGLRVRRTRLRRLLRSTNARRLRAGLRGGARPRADRPSSPAHGRSCSSSSASGTTSTTSPPSAPGVGLAAGTQPLRGAHRARPAAQRAAHRPPVPVRRVAVGGSDARRSTPDASRRRARRARRDPRRSRRRGWRELLFNALVQDRLPDIGIVRARRRAAARRVGPAARAAGVAEDVRADEPAARLRRLRPGRLRAGRRATSRPGSSSGARAASSRFDILDRAARRRPSRPCCRRARRRRSRRSASAASRARAARRSASSSATATASRASACAPARTRTGRPSRTPPPGTCSPTSRSSTRASSSATPAWTADADASPRPPPPPPRDRASAARPRPQPRRSATSTRLVQRLRARADARLEPVRRPASASGSAIVASPRHADVLLVTGPGDDPDARAAAHRVRGDAGAAPRRRARRLRARLRRPRLARRARRPRRGRAPGRPADPRLPAGAGRTLRLMDTLLMFQYKYLYCFFSARSITGQGPT